MNKIWIIVKREFFYRIRKRSFLLLTILMPFLFAALIFVPLALSSIKDNTQKEVVVVDRTGHYAPLFKSNESFRFVKSDKMKTAYRDPDGDTYAVISIWNDLSKQPSAVTVYSTTELSPEFMQMVNNKLEQKVRDDKLASYNIPNLKNIIEKSDVTFDVRTVKWSKEGAELISNADLAMFVGMFFTILIYIFVMSYGGMVMQGVMEEKTNRIVEIMVSSVKPFKLMMGKIIGVALVGLLQLFIWALMIIVIITVCSYAFGLSDVQQTTMIANTAASVPEMSAPKEIFSALQSINFAEIGIMFFLYFIGGYLLYASFFAAVGAAINSHEDSSQFMMPVVMIMIFGLYAGMYSVQNPDGPLAFWCSLFPLTSPIVMMVRLPFDVPLWQELLSLLLLFATAFGSIWLAGKIYRVGILMYGKKPTFKELAKWIKFK